MGELRQLIDYKGAPDKYIYSHSCNINFVPLITYLITYRTPIRYSGQNFYTVFSLFDNLEKIFSEEDRRKIEFIIKIDIDDSVAVSEIKRLKKLPFYIRPVIYKQWEGRWCFQYHQMYLFSLINPKTKFVGTLTDDMVFFVPKAKYLIQEIEKYENDKYVIFWGSPFKNDKKVVIDFYTLYKNNKNYREYPTLFYFNPTPLVSRKVIECMGNVGWSMNIDNTFGLIPLILNVKYGINIIKILQNFVFERRDNPRLDKKDKNIFGEGYRLWSKNLRSDSYIFDLTEQQAKNIYLNIKDDGLLKKYQLYEGMKI